MKRLFATLLMLCILCASALADSLVTNGGVQLDTDALYKAIEAALRAGEKSIRFEKLSKGPEMPDFEQIYAAVSVEPVSA